MAPQALRQLTERTRGRHLKSLRGVRNALSTVHRRFDNGGPAMDVRDFDIPTADGALPARLYRPLRVTATGPLLVFFHGGGFVICDLDTHDALCRRLAAAAGLRIVSVAYRLAPEAPFPAQLVDGEAAVRWALEHAGELGADPARLLVGGDSAGGYIALATAMSLNARRPKAVAGQLLIYPLLELGDQAWTSSMFTHTRIVGRAAVGFIRAQLNLGDATETSLVDIDLAAAPPTVLVLGGALDPCRPDGRRLAARLRAAGRKVTLLEYARLPHGFGSVTNVSRAARRALDEVGAALGRLSSER